MEVTWTEEAREIFTEITDKLPEFHRSIAKRLVKQKAESIAREQGRSAVEKNDLITAFFREVPPAFKEMMRRLFQHCGVDYSSVVDEG